MLLRLAFALLAVLAVTANSGCVIQVVQPQPQPPLLGSTPLAPTGSTTLTAVPTGTTTVTALPTGTTTVTSVSGALPGASASDASHLELGFPVVQWHTAEASPPGVNLNFRWAQPATEIHVDVLYSSAHAQSVTIMPDGPGVTSTTVNDTSVAGFDRRVQVDCTFSGDGPPAGESGSLANFRIQLADQTSPCKLKVVPPTARASGGQAPAMTFAALVTGGIQPVAGSGADAQLRNGLPGPVTPDSGAAVAEPAPGADPTVDW